MSDVASQTDAEGADNGAAPQIKINAQYLKDLSFENPAAPDSLYGGSETPDVQVSVDVNARMVADGHYEVTLMVNAEAKRGDAVVFLVEAEYSGMFEIKGAPADMIEAVCLIECPRFLFPFARQIVADATQNGGFPPLMLEPIDFVHLFQQAHSETDEPGEPDGDSAQDTPAPEA